MSCPSYGATATNALLEKMKTHLLFFLKFNYDYIKIGNWSSCTGGQGRLSKENDKGLHERGSLLQQETIQRLIVTGPPFRKEEGKQSFPEKPGSKRRVNEW